MTHANPVKVLIVDDSAVVRQVLVEILGKDRDIKVIGHAMDPIFAMEKMAKEWPDVILLDVEMPRMDGITFLRKIMAERPTPVIICSSLTAKGAETTMQALSAGAFAIFTKPTLGVKNYLEDASHGPRRRRAGGRGSQDVAPAACSTRPEHSAQAERGCRAGSPGIEAMAVTTDTFTAIGTSTGGTQALEFVLSALPRTCPGIVVVQHMPERFTAAFAERLNAICEIEVREARTGDRVLAGPCPHRSGRQAPGGQAQRRPVSRGSGQRAPREPPLPLRGRALPLRGQVRGEATPRGVIMTGMGDDGARGLLEMKQAGARTIAQDEESCVVFGMPKEAIKLGAADRVVPLQQIPELISR